MSSNPSKLTYDKFAVERTLEGGTCLIDIGIDPSLGPVARKQLHPRYQGRIEFEKLITNEYQILKTLEAKYFVRVFGVKEGTAPSGDRNPILIMEAIDGPALSELIPQLQNLEPVKREQIAKDIISQAIEALSYLHRHEVIHGDLSPDNFILTKQAQVKLIDFSLARSPGVAPHLSIRIAGKAAFRSARVLKSGTPQKEDDCYALGRIAEELLGDQPKQALIHEWIERLLNGELPQGVSESPSSFLLDQCAHWVHAPIQSPRIKTKVVNRERLWTFRLQSFLNSFDWESIVRSRSFFFGSLMFAHAFLTSWVPRSVLQINTLPRSVVHVETKRGQWELETPIWHLALDPGTVVLEFESPGSRLPYPGTRYLKLRNGQSQIYFEDFRNVDTLIR